MAVYRVTVSADQPECNHLSMVPLAEYKIKVGDGKKSTVEGATRAALEAATKAAMDGLLKGRRSVTYCINSIQSEKILTLSSTADTICVLLWAAPKVAP